MPLLERRVQIFDEAFVASCRLVLIFAPGSFSQSSWSGWQQHKWTRPWWCSPQTATRLPASPQTSSLASASVRLLPPLSGRWAPYLPLVRTAPLTPGSVDEWSVSAPVCLSGWTMHFSLKLRAPAYLLHTCFFIYPALFAHVKSSDSAGCQSTSTTPVRDWMKGSCPRCKLYRRYSIIEPTEASLTFPCISGPRSAPSREWNPEYRLSIKKPIT